jgi:glycosyltransferase involved in cell wall biosynthesis
MPCHSHPPPVSEHILASIADPGAGPSYSVRALTAALAGRRAQVALRTVAGWRDGGQAADPCVKVPHTAHARDFARVPVVGDVCASSELHRALKRSARETDVLHGHGLWLMPNIYPAWAVRGRRAKLIVSPRGMLGAEALAFSHRKKQLFWVLLQRRALRQAACLHATGDAEYAEIRAAGLKNPVTIIPNGVDAPALSSVAEFDGPRTVLSLGRIHPKKGLDQLVRAWSRLEAEWPDWCLRIVGPAELGHDHELAALSASLGLKRVAIEGPVFGPAKTAAYRQADIFVLPTRNDNFAMTVAEALAGGTPVISTKGAPWAGLEANGCGWWIDHGVEPLAAALRAVFNLPRDQLRAMGERGRAWMARDFTWDRVSADMLDVYEWVARGGPPPPTIRFE